MSTHQNENLQYAKGEMIYEGKASKLWEVEGDRTLLIIERKDNITKLDGKVKRSIDNKGVYTNNISNLCFRELENHGINTHLVRQLSDTETLIRNIKPLMLEVIVRNVATGSLCKRLPIKDGTVLANPIVEFDYKSDEYGDPLINDDHAIALGIVQEYEDLEFIRGTALEVNDILRQYFAQANIDLFDLKLEVGMDEDGEVIVIDEISPDTCRLRDITTGDTLDKDIFRQKDDTDGTLVAYREVLTRLKALPDNGLNDFGLN